ncbi:MAG: 50S ribosomal protein L10 [Candidatus Nanoarchaeia archaeon]
MNQEQAHVSDKKKAEVKRLAELMNNNKTVMVVSIKNLPASQFQEIRKGLRGEADVKVAKKSLIDFALEHAKEDKLSDLVKYVQDNSAIIFSNEDAFELSAKLSDKKTPAKARPGQVAPEDITVEAGPTSLVPGPDISILSSAGLQVKVEDGKIAIQKPAILVKAGEEVDEQKASILEKLDITPFEVGLEPVAAYSEGKVYVDIKINKQEVLANLLAAYSRGLAFAVSINYACKETIGFIISKAVSHERALDSLIKEPVEEEQEEKAASGGEEKQEEKEEKKEEPKQEAAETEEGQEDNKNKQEINTQNK